MSNVIELRPTGRNTNQSRLTPREVERRYPSLSRPILASRRACGLEPKAIIVSGCIMYEEAEILRFLSSRNRRSKRKKQRCKVYARADTMFEPSDMLAHHVEFCESFREGMGWADAGATVDFGLSNKSDRLLGGFYGLIDEAKKGAFDILLVHDLSHISKGSEKDLLGLIWEFEVLSVHVCDAARLGYGGYYG